MFYSYLCMFERSSYIVNVQLQSTSKLFENVIYNIFNTNSLFLTTTLTLIKNYPFKHKSITFAKCYLHKYFIN